MERLVAFDQRHHAVDEFLTFEVAHLAEGHLAAKVIIPVRIAPGAAERALPGDLDCQRGGVPGQNTAPGGDDSVHNLVYMIVRRRSRIHGWGVYATRTITKNTRIIDYAGEKISNQESLKRERRYIRNGHIWCFKLTNRTVIDAGVGGNVARYVNHSCQPNCYIDIKKGIIWIRAARTLKRGEELTYDYNTDGDGLIKCRCRKDCQRLL